MNIFVRAMAVFAALLLAVAAHAQSYPSRPVRIIVPFPPGGTTDILARVTAERFQSALGQPFIVENRGGAGGVIGTEAAAKAAPDGYTLMLSSSAPLAVGLKLYKKLPYDVMRDFTPNRPRALAVASEKRSELLPDTPTFIELGLPDLVASPWLALVAPAGTPKEIVDRLNDEVNKMLRAPSMKALLEKQGANALIATPAEARDFFRKEIDKWAKVVVESGVKIE